MKCLICSQSNRLTYEKQYLQGVPVIRIANDLGVSESSVRNHMSNHLSRQLSTAFAKKELDGSLDMLGEIDSIITNAKNIFTRNYAKGKDLTALKALDSQRSTLELLCKISAYMHQTKLLELQEQQAGESQEAEQDYAEKLQILTMPELEMLERIQVKLETQDRKMIIIPESKSEYDFTQNKQQFAAVEIESNIIYPIPQEAGLKRNKPPHKSIPVPTQEPTQESISEYNERIEAEEYGSHLYKNGRVISNKKGNPFEGECRNVVVRDL